MVAIGLWVVHQPQASVGAPCDPLRPLRARRDRRAAVRDGFAAFGSYAEAMSQTWSRLVEVPFAGLNFSDVSWALGRPPAEAVEKADEKFCEDYGALALVAVFAPTSAPTRPRRPARISPPSATASRGG